MVEKQPEQGPKNENGGYALDDIKRKIEEGEFRVALTLARFRLRDIQTLPEEIDSVLDKEVLQDTNKEDWRELKPEFDAEIQELETIIKELKKRLTNS